jgi:hypothetical protein
VQGDHQEHQGADTYSPAGTVALHDRDLDSDWLKAPIVGSPVPDSRIVPRPAVRANYSSPVTVFSRE